MRRTKYRYCRASLADMFFFEKDQTNALRGIWCLVILLVHIPAAYQNRIQDMIGSFAYVGVTFFFMTSGYGLMLSLEKKGPAALDGFWSRRLGKLLVPMALTNVLTVLSEVLLTGVFAAEKLFLLTGFVRQLLLFYLVFWAVCRAERGIKAVYAAVILLIGAIYAMELAWGGFWPVEAYGFLYGMVLARNYGRFRSMAAKYWNRGFAAALVCSLVLGVLYLKGKHVPFWGDYLLRILLGISVLLSVLLTGGRISPVNPVTAFLGEISYEVYLLHGLAFTLVEAMGITGSWPFILCSIALTLILSVFVSRCGKYLLSGLKNKK